MRLGAQRWKAGRIAIPSSVLSGVRTLMEQPSTSALDLSFNYQKQEWRCVKVGHIEKFAATQKPVLNRPFSYGRSGSVQNIG